jgi:hypothetical protein
LASFFAASINCGVIASGGGAAARAGEANTVPSANPVALWSILRLESFGFRMVPIYLFSNYRLSARQRSIGNVSQTSVPFGTAVFVEVMMRSTVPSDVSTM